MTGLNWGLRVSGLRRILTYRPDGGKNISALCIFTLVAMISIGPRINLFHSPGDFRFQDFTVIPLMLGLTLVFDLRKIMLRSFRSPASHVLATAQLTIFISATLALIMAVYYSANLTELTIRLGFILRLSELPLMGILAGRLVLRAGYRGARSVLFGLIVGGALNGAWITTQLISGVNRPLFTLSPTVPAMYGPGLVGEGGVLGTGHYLVILIAVLGSISLYTSKRTIRYGAIFFTAVAYGFQFAVNSRASIVVSTVVVFCIIVLHLAGGKWLSKKMVVALVLAAIAGITAVAMSNGRLRFQAVYSAMHQRLHDWHLPTLEAVSGNAFFGLGPGGSRIAIRGETHSSFLLFIGDFGILGLALVLALWLILANVSAIAASGDGDALVRTFALASFLISLDWPIAGLVQDSVLPVNSNHLAVIVVGTFLTVLHLGRKANIGNTRTTYLLK